MTDAPLGPPITIKDVATLAGVSPGTVSNVLNRPGRVADETRTRVLRAIEETGYVPNAAASRLRSLENRAIGIIVVDVGNFIHAHLAKGALHVAEEHGYVAMLCDGDRSVERVHRMVDFLESQRVAGVLATGSSLEGVAERLAELRRRGVATVLVDAPAKDPTQCSVAVNDVHGGELVGRHLLDIGRRRITYVDTDLIFRPFEERYEGLCAAIAERPDLGADVQLVRLPMTQYDQGDAAVDAIVSHGSDAAFCINDYVAFAVMRSLQTRGIRVPEDVAVVGYDDTEYAAMTSVPLTSVRQPARLVGETAARLLIEECAGGDHVHQHVMFQPELVARVSTLGAARDAVAAPAPRDRGWLGAATP